MRRFAGRVSAPTLAATQMRLCRVCVSYVLLPALRRLDLAGTELVSAPCHAIRQLPEAGARVTGT